MAPDGLGGTFPERDVVRESLRKGNREIVARLKARQKKEGSLNLFDAELLADCRDTLAAYANGVEREPGDAWGEA